MNEKMKQKKKRNVLFSGLKIEKKKFIFKFFKNYRNFTTISSHNFGYFQRFG